VPPEVCVKVLFLDIDGVLNSTPFLDSIRETDDRVFAGHESDRWWLTMIDGAAAERICRIVSATGCMVIVSSSWRRSMPLAQLRRILAVHSIAIAGITPAIQECQRGDEITKWLDANPTDSYVVIDDYDDAGNGHEDRFVQTDCFEGLLDSHVERAIEILGAA
jgi:hypothetical protein